VWVWNLFFDIKGGTLTVSDNRMLRRIFGQKRVEVIGVGENCIMRR
jgi:hypothetical protein